MIKNKPQQFHLVGGVVGAGSCVGAGAVHLCIPLVACGPAGKDSQSSSIPQVYTAIINSQLLVTIIFIIYLGSILNRLCVVRVWGANKKTRLVFSTNRVINCWPAITHTIWFRRRSRFARNFGQPQTFLLDLNQLTLYHSLLLISQQLEGKSPARCESLPPNPM